MKFALFFMAEYQKMIVVSMIGATLFLGGYREFWFLKDTFLSVDRAWFLGPAYLFIKVVVLLGIMIWVRASWPRIRYDRLMSLGWKILIPLSLAVVFITATGILLKMFWIIPVISLLVGLIPVMVIYRDLRRKAYERA
jgi:NADH-quinone oxidoreductase subunit H